MRVRLSVFLATVLVLGFSACVDHAGIANSWVGRNVDDLIYNWGPPARVHEFPDGRKVVQFSHASQVGVVGSPGGYVAGGYTAYCNLNFNTDAFGIIRSWKADGNLAGCNKLFGRKPRSP